MKIPRRPLTLRLRLIAALLVFSFVGLAVFAVVSVALLRHSLMSQVDNGLQRHSAFRILNHQQRLPSGYLITIFGPDAPEKSNATEKIGQPPDQSGGPALDRATVHQHAASRSFTVPDQAGGSH